MSRNRHNTWGRSGKKRLVTPEMLSVQAYSTGNTGNWDSEKNLGSQSKAISAARKDWARKECELRNAQGTCSTRERHYPQVIYISSDPIEEEK